MATTIVPLSVATPPDLATASSSDPSEAEPSPCDSNGDEPSGGANSAYEQSAVAALLGLAAWPSSPDDESRDDEQQQASAFGDAAEHLWECAAADRGTQAYHSSDELYSPKFRNHLVDYDTPGYPSPKRMRAPKDGAKPPSSLITARPDLLTLPDSLFIPNFHRASGNFSAGRPRPPGGPNRAADAPATPAPPALHPRAISPPHLALRPSPPPPAHVLVSAGAPPPGTSRFRCKFPGCSKLYASTDAVRKHCRKRHLEWLRQIDRYSAHEVRKRRPSTPSSFPRLFVRGGCRLQPEGGKRGEEEQGRGSV